MSTENTVVIRQSWDTFSVRNGRHSVRYGVRDDATGLVTWSEPVVLTVANPEIDIRAQDEDKWVVTRRKTDSGGTNKLEVDRNVVVRINGVLQ